MITCRLARARRCRARSPFYVGRRSQESSNRLRIAINNMHRSSKMVPLFGGTRFERTSCIQKGPGRGQFHTPDWRVKSRQKLQPGRGPRTREAAVGPMFVIGSEAG